MSWLVSTRKAIFISVLNLSGTVNAMAGFESWCGKRLQEGGDDARSLQILAEKFSTKGCTALGEKLGQSEDLWLNSLGLRSLNFLKFFPGLSRLDLTDNHINDLSSLQDLPSLTHLWLGENEIKDLGPVSSLKNLQLLVLEDNQLRDAEPLSGCHHLIALDLGRNHLNDLDFFSTLPNIRYAFLNHNFVGNLSSIAWAGDSLHKIASASERSGKINTRILNTIQINWSDYLGQKWNLAENFRVYHLEGNPILREFWESGYVKKKPANCPVSTRFQQIRSVCSSSVFY